MRNFCIHCGVANAPQASNCLACGRLLVAAGRPTATYAAPVHGPTPAGTPLSGPAAWTGTQPPPATLPAAGNTLAPVPVHAYQPWAPRTDGANALSDLSTAPTAGWPLLPEVDPAWGPDQLAPYAANFGMRAVALIVDLTAGSVALSFVFILLGLLQLATNASNATIGALALISLVAWWPLYFVSFWSRSGRTLGYRVAGLQLVKSDGSMPTFATALVRFMGASLTVSSLFVGYLCILWDRRKQAVHDKFAGTMVVKE